MNIRDTFTNTEHFGAAWWRLLIRGSLMVVIGAFLILFTLFKPDVSLMRSHGFSWLPLCGLVILAVGLLEGFDTIMAKALKDFFLGLQNSILDIVVAILIVFSVGGDPLRLSLLIAGFLIIKGIFRITLIYAMNLPHVISTFGGSVVSIILGILIWQQWPFSSAWFLAFCLSVEIALRGWAVTQFALWSKSQQQQNLMAD